MTTNPKNKNQIVFRRNDQIGSTSAEDDEDFLENCFIDSGDFELLADKASKKQIIVGRTGSGKSALLWKVNNRYNDKTINLAPDNLALTYVSNSDIVIYFSKIGVNLDPFYKLLWRHILTVEVLKKYVQNHPGVKKDGFVDTIWSVLMGKGKERKKEKETLEYLKSWGEDFWLETEYRVKEITKKLEEQMKASIKASGGKSIIKGGFSFEEFEKLTKEQKIDVVHKAQKIVSTTQVQDLSRVISLLNEVLQNKQQTYYISIDGLDENWVEDELRYKLIMALIVTIKDLNRVDNVKIFISMRRDLIDRVFKKCRTSGFQEEKYRDYYLTLKWSKDDLVKLIDARINHLLINRYSKKTYISHQDILPKKINKIDITNYVMERVSRPRDVISFFNTCIDEASGSQKITAQMVKIAEGEYSRSRLRALADEWQSDYPNLLDIMQILKERTESFKLSTLTKDEISEYCLNLSIKWSQASLIGVEKKILDCAEGKFLTKEVIREIIRVLYVVGVIGLKIETFESYSWSDESGRSISISEITEETGVKINATYYRSLGVKAN